MNHDKLNIPINNPLEKIGKMNIEYFFIYTFKQLKYILKKKECSLIVSLRIYLRNACLFFSNAHNLHNLKLQHCFNLKQNKKL